MPASALLLAGAAFTICGVALLWATTRLAREVESTRRLLHRVTVAVDEIERVDQARRRLAAGGSLARESATGVNEVVRRSGLAIAGIPYAVLEGISRIRRGDGRPDL